MVVPGHRIHAARATPPTHPGRHRARRAGGFRRPVDRGANRTGARPGRGMDHRRDGTAGIDRGHADRICAVARPRHRRTRDCAAARFRREAAARDRTPAAVAPLVERVRRGTVPCGRDFGCDRASGRRRRRRLQLVETHRRVVDWRRGGGEPRVVHRHLRSRARDHRVPRSKLQVPAGSWPRLRSVRRT